MLGHVQVADGVILNVEQEDSWFVRANAINHRQVACTIISYDDRVTGGSIAHWLESGSGAGGAARKQNLIASRIGLLVGAGRRTPRRGCAESVIGVVARRTVYIVDGPDCV